VRRGLLSWGCQSSPLRRHPCRSSTPDIVAAPRSCPQAGSGDPAIGRGAVIGPELPPSGLVPPLPFLPASTVYSALHVSGLLHPETDHGVRHVSGFRVRDGFLPRPSPARAGSGAGPARSPPGGCLAGRAHLLFRWAPESRDGVAELPGGTVGFPWPSPVALHPSKLSPSRELCRVNRFVLPRSADLPFSGNRIGSCLWHADGSLSRATAVVAFSSLWSCWFRRSVSSRKRVGTSWLASLAHSTSRPWSPVKSVATRSRCRFLVARCSLGLRLVRICSRLTGAVVFRVPGCRSVRVQPPRRWVRPIRGPPAITPSRSPSRQQAGGRSDFRRSRPATFPRSPRRRSYEASADPTGAASRRSAIPRGMAKTPRPVACPS
jgi:hypothetical protein